MKFQPKTEKEVSEAGLFEKGTYAYEVISADDEISAKGNEMIKLKIWLYKEDGQKSSVFDYLMESIGYKLRHAAFTMGLGAKYDSGELVASDFVGKTGYAKVAIQKDKNEQYPDKNIITDYVGDEKGPATSAAADPYPKPANKFVPELDDEIPF